MLVEATSREVIELQAGGPEDPDGLRAATVLSAYLHAEHMRAIRQLLWRRLAVLIAGWLALGTLTSLLSRFTVVAGVALLVAVAIGAAIIEWRAAENLHEFLRIEHRIVRRTPLSSQAG